MSERQSVPAGERRYGYVVATDEPAPERATVLQFLVQPHGLEPGKVSHLEIEQMMVAPPTVNDLIEGMKVARQQSDRLEITTIVYLALSGLVGVMLMLTNAREWDRQVCGDVVVFALLCATVNSAASYIRFGSRQAAIARMMSRYPDLRVVGPLAQSLSLADEETVHLVKLALRFLLPRLRADDGHLLNDAQRNCLYHQLRVGDVELKLAILKTLEQIGDAKAIPYVDRLCHGNGRIDARVRRAAEECLPFLLIRAEHEIAPRILLRASSNADTAPETLLRTAIGHRDTEANLLRPTE